MKSLLIFGLFVSISLSYPQSVLHKNLYNHTEIFIEKNSLDNNEKILHSEFLYIKHEQRNSYSPLNLAGQLVTGSASAVGFSILPYSAGFAASWSGKKIAASLWGSVAISAFILGSAAGVYWIAELENPEINFLHTLKYSVIGAGVGTILIVFLAKKYTTLPEFGTTIALLCPVISSMIYASFISEWSDNSTVSHSKKINHKDIIEQSKIAEFKIIIDFIIK